MRRRYTRKSSRPDRRGDRLGVDQVAAAAATASLAIARSVAVLAMSAVLSTVALAGVVVTAGPAAAAPAEAGMLGPQNSRALAESLQDASRQQGICYGWDVTLEDNWSSYTTTREVGSNLGVGVDPRNSAQCGRWVVLDVDVVWTSSSSESSDSAIYHVESNISAAPTVQDLQRIGITEEKLIGDTDVRTIYNAVVALPQLVAENSGQVQAPSPSPSASQLPADAHVAGSPGSDFIRSNRTVLLCTVGLGGLGLAWLLFALFGKRNDNRNLSSTHLLTDRDPY